MTSAHSEITPGRNSGRPKGYIPNYQPYGKTLALLADVQTVLNEYADHLPLTCRQIFYRLVATRGYPKTESFYRNKLCPHIANARRGRMIPFDAIRDDGVSVVEPHHWADTDHFLYSVRKNAERYTRDRLAAQEIHLEVWCEAAGLVPQIARVALNYSVQTYSCSGFDSLTAKKRLADRICDIGKPAVILHLGDHDPSGVAIFEAAAADVAAFVEADRLSPSYGVTFVRVALTPFQIDAFDLPTAPAKKTDSRSKRWKGETCQLEALPPDAIAEILKAVIESQLDMDQVYADIAREKADRIMLTRTLPAPGGTP